MCALPAPKAKPTTPVGSSWEDTGVDDICMIIQGQYSAGKTTLAGTLDPSFPWPFPTIKYTAKEPKYRLNTLHWLTYDKKALVSFRERGIAVSRFDVRDYMAKKNCAVMAATEVGLRDCEAAVTRGARWIVVDTLSTYDKMLDAYWQDQLLSDTGAKETNASKSHNKLIEGVQIQKYGRMFVCHKMLHDALMSLGCGVIYLTHSKAMMDLGLGTDDEREKQRKVRQTMQVAASGGVFVPDITGKGAGVYKADARLQLVVTAKKGPNGMLTRSITADSVGGYETKNSWELSIKGEHEAHLGKMLARVSS